MILGDAPRLLITTYDAAGTPTTSAEFVVPVAEDTVAAWTPHTGHWVERLRLTPVVSVQAAGRGGRPLRDQPVLEGRAELFTSGTEVAAAESRVKEKYGFAAAVANAVDKAWELGGTQTEHCAVVIRIIG